MGRGKFYVVMAILSLLSLLAVACGGPKEATPTPTPAGKQLSQEESQRIAEQFVRNEATFVFDGLPETLILKESKEAQHPFSGWIFIFTYDSRHAGYGDRTGKVLAEVITPHEAAILVDQGKVTHAFLNRKWEMILQNMGIAPPIF